METIIVCLIVAGALAVTARSLYRSLTGRDEGCKCAGGSSCPMSEESDTRQFVSVDGTKSKTPEAHSSE